MLAVIETHPIQYHAPVYRALQTRFAIPVTAIYGSDFSLSGYLDREFESYFAWDTDLLSGYSSVFLSRVSQGGGSSLSKVSARGLATAIRRVAPLAVLIVGYSPVFHQLAFYHVWSSGYPILFRAETTEHAKTRNPTHSWIRSLALHWMYEKCAALLYIGQRSYDHFAQAGCPPEKLVFSPYCVDVSPFETDEQARARLRSAARQTLRIDEKHIILLFSGKLSRRKRPDLLLLGIKELPREIRERTVGLFLGSGELKPMLERLSVEEPPVRAIFLGFQNQTLLSQYYHAADLLVLPSRHSETWGLVVNEALHHGLPCVVSDAVGCAPDLIELGVTGHIFEAGSFLGLASALCQGLGLIGRPEVREQCRQKVSGYTVEKAAEGIARAYRDIETELHKKHRPA